MEIPVYLIVPAIVVAAVLFLLMAFSSRYKTVSPDEALIVTGAALTGSNVVEDASGRRIKIVRGGGAFILPVFQRYEKLSLLTHKLEVRTPEVVYTSQGVPILADGVAIVKVGSSVEDVATAAEQFLTKPPDALEAEAREVLEGHLRAIMGAMTVEEVYRHRDKFAQEIQGVAALDLKKMGLQIVAFTIKDVRDPHGYLEALGKPRIAAVKREAEIAEAQAYRDARVQKAAADEEAMKAELLRDTRVAEANKEKELQIATFKREQDTAKAEADQAYFIQEARSKQAVTENQMQVELTRKEREIELEEKEIRRRANQYDAEVKKKADAERYAIEQSAEATKLRQMREAEALQYRIEAEARAKAEQQRLEGLAQADAERARGTAEADVIRLKGLAEAEAKQKLAEAFEKFGQAAVLDILVKMMPELAGRIAEPLRSIDKITVVDTGHGEGAARVSNYVTSLMSTAPEMLKSVAGIDVQELIRRFTARAVEGKTEAEAEG
ncbi:MAG: flotillin family protein [Chlorobi bacterium CHB2]|nr:flotillin family protein [Chlorobi bacterium CHB2]